MTATDSSAALVATIGEHLLQLCGQAAVAPVQARASVGDVSVELGWLPAAPAAPAAPGAPAGRAPRPGPERPAGAAGPPADLGTAVEPGAGTVSFPLCSSSVGVFYRAPEPGAPPFVVEGDVVRAGQQVGIVEAMKLMIPLTAEEAGRVVSVLAADGAPVEYGQPLFLLEPLPEGDRGAR